MQKKIKTPLISEELINYLEQLFHEKCADLKDTEKEIFHKRAIKIFILQL